VTRGQNYFCGRCALAHDWEEIIAIAQEATRGALAALPTTPVMRAFAAG